MADSSAGPAEAPASLDLTVVVPYFNPGVQLRKSVGELMDVLEQLGLRYEVIAVSDGSTDDSEGTLGALMPIYQPDIVLGSKRHPMSEVEYPPLRRPYSWGFQQLVRRLFHLTVRDTQTGIKPVRRDVLAAMLLRLQHYYDLPPEGIMELEP